MSTRREGCRGTEGEEFLSMLRTFHNPHKNNPGGGEGGGEVEGGVGGGGPVGRGGSPRSFHSNKQTKVLSVLTNTESATAHP